MPVILPFQAFRSHNPVIYVPGEDAPSANTGTLTQDTEAALFFYRQRFRLTEGGPLLVREGVMGLLNREAAVILPHEQVFPERVAACAVKLRDPGFDPGSLWLWCNASDDAVTGAPLRSESPDLEMEDRFGTCHQIWTVTNPERIRAWQAAFEGKELFLADGHHRYAAGWNLATIQFRNAALISLPSHRLVFDPVNVRLPPTHPLSDVEHFLVPGSRRGVVVTPGPNFGGFEVAQGASVFSLLTQARVQPVRGRNEAISAVQFGQAPMAILTAAPLIDQIEKNARLGKLLPPKSTDFFPKLAAGLIIHRHQNETVTPAVAHSPGVRNPSS